MLIVLIPLLTLEAWVFWRILLRHDMKDKTIKPSTAFPGSAQSAVHEAGHALVAHYCTLVREVIEVKAAPHRGGLTTYRPSDHSTPDGLWCDAVISLAGVAAELRVYGKTRSGEAKTDLQHCYRVVEQLMAVNQLAPPWKRIHRRKHLPFHQMFEGSLTLDQQAVMDQAYNMAHLLLARHESKFHRLIELLMEKRKIGPHELNQVMGTRFMMRYLHPSVLFVWPRSKS